MIADIEETFSSCNQKEVLLGAIRICQNYIKKDGQGATLSILSMGWFQGRNRPDLTSNKGYESLTSLILRMYILLNLGVPFGRAISETISEAVSGLQELLLLGERDVSEVVQPLVEERLF